MGKKLKYPRHVLMKVEFFLEISKKSPLTGSAGAAVQMQNFDLAGFLAGTTKSSEDAQAGGKKK